MPSKGSGGTVYWYFARNRKNLIRLPDLPDDHPDFIAAYSVALAGSGPVCGIAKPRHGTTGALHPVTCPPRDPSV